MKLSAWAKKHGLSYQTAWNQFKLGQIEGAFQLPSGTITVEQTEKSRKPEFNVIYSRVSSSENKPNLESQARRLSDFCIANGWKIDQIVMETGSGLNENRKKLNKVLEEGKATRLIVEHKDRLTRFGFNYIKMLCNHIGCELVVVNNAEDDKADLVEDFISVITSFCARIYGQRRSKRKTEKLIENLRENGTS